jgi:hypothetical protein
MGAAPVGGGRRAIGAPVGGAEVWLPLGAALGAGPPGAIRGAGAAAGGGAGGAGGWPARGGGCCVLSRSSSRSRSCCCMAGPPAGGRGAVGAGAAAGGGACGAAGGGGAAGCGGGGGGGAAGCGGGGGGAAGCGGGGGGAGRGGGGGGAGRAGGAAFGASLGRGLPSGPTSSLACATTIGADCAWDGVVANCMAVRAVVASSASRNFIMTAWVLMGIIGRNPWQGAFGEKSWVRWVKKLWDQQTSVRPDCGGVQTGTRIYFNRDTIRAGTRS